MVVLRDRRLIRLSGNAAIDDVLKLLQGLVTQDCRKIPETGVASAAFLNIKGKVLADVILWRRPDEMFVDCHSDVCDKLQKLLRRQAFRMPLQIGEANDLAVHVRRRVCDGFVADPRYAGLGARAILPQSESTVPECFTSDDDYHALRIACGVPEGPTDMPPDTQFPLSCNMELTHSVHLQKGCYIGQENTARTYFRGVVRRRFMVASGPVRQGDNVLDEKGSVIGEVTSASGEVGLCLYRGKADLKKPDDFAKFDLKGTCNGAEIALRAPPYVHDWA